MNRYLEESLSSDREDCDEKIFINTPKTKNFKWSFQLESPKPTETPKSVKNKEIKNQLYFTYNPTTKNTLTQTLIPPNYFSTNVETKVDKSVKVEPLPRNQNMCIKVTESERIEKVMNKNEENEEVCECVIKNKILKNLVSNRANKTFLIKSFFDKWLINSLKEKSKEYKEKFIKNLRQTLQSPSFEWKEDEADKENLLKTMMNTQKREDVLKTSPVTEDRNLIKRTHVVKMQGTKKKTSLSRKNEISFNVPPLNSKKQTKFGISNQIQIEKQGKKQKSIKNTESQTEKIPALFKANTTTKEKIIRTNNFFKGLEVVNEINHESVPKFLKKIIVTNNQIHYERGFNLFKNEQVESNEMMFQILQRNKLPNLDISHEISLEKKPFNRVYNKINEIQLETPSINKKTNLVFTKEKDFNILAKNSSLEEKIKQGNVEKIPIVLFQHPALRTDEQTRSQILSVTSNETDLQIIQENKTSTIPEKLVEDISRSFTRNYMLDNKISQTEPYEVTLSPEQLPLVSIESNEKEEELIMEEYDSFSILPDLRVISYNKASRRLKNIILIRKIKENALLKEKFEKLRTINYLQRNNEKSIKELKGERNVMVTIQPSRNRISKRKSIYSIIKISYNSEFKIKSIYRKKLERWKDVTYRIISYKENLEKNMKENRSCELSLHYDQKKINFSKGTSCVKETAFKQEMKKNKILSKKFEKWVNLLWIERNVDEKENKILKEFQRNSKFFKGINLVKNICLMNKFRFDYNIYNKRLINWLKKSKIDSFKESGGELISIIAREDLISKRNATNLFHMLLTNLSLKYKYLSMILGFDSLRDNNLLSTISEKIEKIKEESKMKIKAFSKMNNIFYKLNQKTVEIYKGKFLSWRNLASTIKSAIEMIEKFRNENFFSLLTNNSLIKDQFIYFFQNLKDQDLSIINQIKISKLKRIILKENKKKNYHLLNEYFKNMWKFSIHIVKTEIERKKDKFTSLVNTLHLSIDPFGSIEKYLFSNIRSFFQKFKHTKQFSNAISILEEFIIIRTSINSKLFFDKLCCVYEEKLTKSLETIEISKKLNESPSNYLHFGIPFMISFLGFILIASLESFREGFSFIPNFSPYFNCSLISIWIFFLMIKSHFDQNKRKKIMKKYLINKLEVLKQRTKEGINEEEEEEVRKNCEKIQKIEKIEEVNLETTTTYIPTDENINQTSKINVDEEVFEESINLNEKIADKEKDVLQKIAEKGE